jgi:hypothetical protein
MTAPTTTSPRPRKAKSSAANSERTGTASPVPDAQHAAVALAGTISRFRVGLSDYWVALAEILLRGLLATASLDPGWTTADVVAWVFDEEMPFDRRYRSETLATLLTAHASTDEEIRARVEWALGRLAVIWRLHERVRRNVYAAAQMMVTDWLDDAGTV